LETDGTKFSEKKLFQTFKREILERLKFEKDGRATQTEVLAGK
jgi:hypothetical protein